MADIPTITLRSCAKNTNLESLIRPNASDHALSVTDLPKQLQELLGEVVVTPTLRERMQNWGSD